MAKFNAFSPRLSGRYEWDRNASTYATISKGFRSGGFNGNGSTYDPETLVNMEIGHKAQMSSGLFFDGAIYFADYKDRQAQAGTEISPGVFRRLQRMLVKPLGQA